MTTKTTKAAKTKKTTRDKTPNFKWGYDPLLSLMILKSSVDEMFAEIFANKSSLQKEPINHPNADIYTHRGKYHIDIELPGAGGENLRFHLTDNYFILWAHEPQKITVDENDFYLHERKSGFYTKSIPLKCNINPGKFDAILENGVLKIVAEIIEQKTEDRRQKTE